MPFDNKPTNSRQHIKQTQRNLAIAVILILVCGGGAAIALFYGAGSAILGLTCLLAGAALFGLIWLILTPMERWTEE